jgi:hypothetical protein
MILWIIASTVLMGVAAYWIYTLEKRTAAMAERYEKMLSLADEADQGTILQLLSQLNAYETRFAPIEDYVTRVSTVLPHIIQGYGIVRYDAFDNIRGEQSFSIALIDEGGNGVVISALHAHSDTRIYAKQLEAWRSEHSLSAEEQQALGQARQVLEGKRPPAQPEASEDASV